MGCDCVIGGLSGSAVRISTIDSEVQEIVDLQTTLKERGLLKGDVPSKKQIVDGRKGYLQRFTYCPYCGIKINWKQVFINYK